MPGQRRGEGTGLSYPCTWSYTVIGRSEADLARAIDSVAQARDHEVSQPRRSSDGNYCAVTLRLTVFDERDRRSIYEALRERAETIIVL